METERKDQKASLWADLEAEYQAFDAGPVALPSEEPPDRRLHLLGERFPQAVFSGLLPALSLCFFAALWVVPDWNSTLSVAITLLLAVPVAVVVGPLFTRIRPILLAGVAFLIAGTVHLLAAGLDSWRVTVVHSTIGPLERVAILQEAMETTFSWPFFSLFVLAGLVVSLTTSAFMKRHPWRDQTARGVGRLGLAWTVAAVPLLLVAVCLFMNLLIPPRNALWLAEMQRQHPQSFRLAHWNSELVQPWNELLVKWTDSLPSGAARVDRQQRVEATSPETVRLLEAEFLSLWREGKEFAWPASPLASLFLEKHQELQDPVETNLALVELAFDELRDNNPSAHAKRSFVQLIDTLSGTELSSSQLERVRTVVEASRKLVLDPVADMDRLVAAGLRWTVTKNDRIYPQSFKLFGLELETSPTALWIEYRDAHTFSHWVSLRDTLLLDVKPEDQVEYLRDLVSDNSPESHTSYLSRRFFGREMDAYLQTAELIIKLRRHKLESGVWPTDIAELIPQAPDRWRLEDGSQGLTLIDKGLPAGEKSTWVLK